MTEVDGSQLAIGRTWFQSCPLFLFYFFFNCTFIFLYIVFNFISELTLYSSCVLCGGCACVLSMWRVCVWRTESNCSVARRLRCDLVAKKKKEKNKNNTQNSNQMHGTEAKGIIEKGQTADGWTIGVDSICKPFGTRYSVLGTADAIMPIKSIPIPRIKQFSQHHYYHNHPSSGLFQI